MTGISAGSFCPSASSVTTNSRAELDAQGVADAQRVAVPEVLVEHEGHRTGVLATWSVLSLPPSTMTRVVTARPQASSGMAARTAPMLSSSS